MADVTETLGEVANEVSKDPKNWYQSKTVWGGILALAAVGIAGAKGGGCAEAATMIESLSANADKVIGLLGGCLAIYGRMKATSPVAPVTVRRKQKKPTKAA